MTNWIDFGRGPLFRLCFALMVLGLARILILTLLGIQEACRRNPDKIVAWKEIRYQPSLGCFLSVVSGGSAHSTACFHLSSMSA